MNHSLNICLPCGLCCNGTLIGHVQLDKEELPRLKEFMDIEDEDGNGFFLQPCNKYCNGCTVYSKRPKQCASFNCGLLESVDNKELEFVSAVEIVKEVNQIKIDIEKSIALLKIELHSESFYFKMVELKKVLQKIKSESLLTENHIKLASDLKQLDGLLEEKFNLSSY